MDFKYADEQNALMVVALLKAHGIRKVVVSPGATNICLNASMQHDGSFELYSCIDERSAAYMACGLAAESGEPVVITCTEATASRDYLPGLTEAYHRKLPVLAITGMHGYSRVGHLEPQTIDRSVSPSDALRLKVNLPIIKDETDVWDSQIKINKAILELTRHGGGPAQINLPSPKRFYTFTEQSLPPVRAIRRFAVEDAFPKLPEGRIAVFVGSHKAWRAEEADALDAFCEQTGAVVFCDHSSKYHGKHGVHAYGVSVQQYPWEMFEDIRLVIHLGEEAADEPTASRMTRAAETWRVSEDGELRDTFRNLTCVFEMDEESFFRRYYQEGRPAAGGDYLELCRECCSSVAEKTPDVPLSNIYVASKMAPALPEGSSIHLGVSNTIRSWSYFELPDSVHADGNMGCRGIDGAVSASIGVSLVHPDTPAFCVLGDLTFFYDMGALGNRHIGANYRMLVVNNGGGNIFKQPGHMGHHMGNENAAPFVCAGGHYGGRGSDVIRQYADALGFKYLRATNKDEFDAALGEFVSPRITGPMLFEVVTSDDDEVEAFQAMAHIAMDPKAQIKQQAKKILGDRGASLVRGILNR